MQFRGRCVEGRVVDGEGERWVEVCKRVEKLELIYLET